MWGQWGVTVHSASCGEVGSSTTTTLAQEAPTSSHRQQRAAVLQLAIDRGFTVNIPDRYHEVTTTCRFGFEQPVDGVDRRGEKFPWTFDLLDTDYYHQLAAEPWPQEALDIFNRLTDMGYDLDIR